jgi:hypothetical protein
MTTSAISATIRCFNKVEEETRVDFNDAELQREELKRQLEVVCRRITNCLDPDTLARQKKIHKILNKWPNDYLPRQKAVYITFTLKMEAIIMNILETILDLEKYKWIASNREVLKCKNDIPRRFREGCCILKMAFHKCCEEKETPNNGL